MTPRLYGCRSCGRSLDTFHTGLGVAVIWDSVSRVLQANQLEKRRSRVPECSVPARVDLKVRVVSVSLQVPDVWLRLHVAAWTRNSAPSERYSRLREPAGGKEDTCGEFGAMVEAVLGSWRDAACHEL